MQIAINDLQIQADKLLTLAAKLAPDLSTYEELKTVFSDATTRAGEALRFSSALGMVETRKGSAGGVKGAQTVLDEERYNALPPGVQTELRLAGVVKTIPVMGRASKPAVCLKLAPTLKPAA